MDLDGERREFDARITECSLDERVSWATVEGPLRAETITLRPVGETRTQIVAQLEADVALLMPSDRHGQESLNKRLKADLASFKRLIELDDEDAVRQIAGGGQINIGAHNSAARNLSSPATLAARARHRNAGRSATERGMFEASAGGHADTAADPGRVSRGAGSRLQTGAAGMGGPTGAAGLGGRAMPTDDVWGDGTVNEEERGSARDF
jgi:hypothetical protein